MEALGDYNAISRAILKKHEQKLTAELRQRISSGKQVATVSHITLDDHELILLHFQNIPTTMILSEEWPRSLVTSKRSFGFAAEEQSEGRGQYTNAWGSPTGNMYLTLLVLKELGCGRYFSMLMANHTVRTIKTYFKDAQKADKIVYCKWVNDIFIGNLKVCGSLVRASNEGDQFYFQIGIGVNLKVSPLEGSTCLQAETKRTINVKDFTIDYAREAIRIIFGFDASSLKSSREEYRKHLLYLMQKVNIFRPDQAVITHSGIFEDVTEEGMAVLLNQNGERQTISNGKMRPIFYE